MYGFSAARGLRREPARCAPFPVAAPRLRSSRHDRKFVTCAAFPCPPCPLRVRRGVEGQARHLSARRSSGSACSGAPSFGAVAALPLSLLRAKSPSPSSLQKPTFPSVTLATLGRAVFFPCLIAPKRGALGLPCAPRSRSRPPRRASAACYAAPPYGCGETLLRAPRSGLLGFPRLRHRQCKKVKSVKKI